MIVQLHDRATLKSSKIDDRTGYLRADAVFSRVGIQEYRAFELGLQDRDPNAIVRVLRTAEEVGKPESLNSLKLIPTTDDHPSEDVNARNFRRLATGMTGENVTFDGKLTHGTVVLTHQDAIAKWNNGKKELSVGYACEVVLESGVHPEFGTYDAKQINIIANHVAQVDAGRCGGACRIVDGACQDCGKPPSEGASCNCHRNDDMSTGTGQAATPALVQRTVDGITIQVTDQGAQVIDKLLGQLSAAETAKSAAEQALKDAEAKHKTEIETKQGEIDGLKAKIPDAAALDRLATERAALIADVKKVMGADYDPSGKSNLDLMKDAVAKKLGGEDHVKDKSEDYIRGVFATIKTDVTGTTNDSVRHVVMDGPPASYQRQNDGKPSGRDAYIERLKAASSAQQKAS